MKDRRIDVAEHEFYMIDDKDWYDSFDTTGRAVRLAEIIDEDGEREYVVLDMREDRLAHCPCDPPPAHEQLGRLPRDVAERVGAICGVITSTGKKPCRNRRGSCPWHHQDQESASGTDARARA